ncbi:MAG: oxaloacetate decarboxylase [Saprospirales bacterium]|nr:oxaloacetate decarboxylase [Saprospirales bacterium]
MKKEIKLCLIYRDMWQSSGKYMPRVDQLVRIAEPIIDMGCFARVETNGGGFEQIQLLAGENPNTAVRKWTKPFNEAGIQTQMLERGLNALRMGPVAADIRRLMFKLKKKQGTDISRSFDGLNYAPNLELSFRYAKEAGMIAQGALCITHSRLHTVDYFINLADQFIELGAQEIAIKDMAGIGRPVSIGRMVKGIKDRHPEVLVQYHGHSTTGFSVASSLEAARNGADIIDVGMEPLAWGTGHADLLTVHAMLVDAGFSVPDINMKAYMKVRTLSQEFIDDFLGYYISPRNRQINALVIGPGLPGGMMGSLMSDLDKHLKSLNNWLEKRGQETLTQDEMLVRLFDEVEYIWPKLGYPPLVTPYSQYVKNVAQMNVIQMIKGQPRWSMIDENTWNMLLGKTGQLPGPLDPELLDLAKQQDRYPFQGNLQDLYPDELELFARRMEEKGWDYGEDDEELFEFAMHPQQYEEYRSGQARDRLEKELMKFRNGSEGTAPGATPSPAIPVAPKEMRITVNGESYDVKIAYGDQSAEPSAPKAAPQPESHVTNGNGDSYDDVASPLEGKFHLTKDPSQRAIKIGDKIKQGQPLAYIESMKVYNAITAEKDGIVIEIFPRPGDEVVEDQVILRIKTQ